jgi:hypothetical protein
VRIHRQRALLLDTENISQRRLDGEQSCHHKADELETLLHHSRNLEYRRSEGFNL